MDFIQIKLEDVTSSRGLTRQGYNKLNKHPNTFQKLEIMEI